MEELVGWLDKTLPQPTKTRLPTTTTTGSGHVFRVENTVGRGVYWVQAIALESKSTIGVGSIGIEYAISILLHIDFLLVLRCFLR